MKSLAEVLEMPASERLQLLEVIWDSLVETPDAVPLTDEMRAELDTRLSSYYRDRNSAKPWDEIKDELFRSKGTEHSSSHSKLNSTSPKPSAGFANARLRFRLGFANLSKRSIQR